MQIFVNGRSVYARPQRANLERFYSIQAAPVRFTVPAERVTLAMRVDTPLMTGVYQLPFELHAYRTDDHRLVGWALWGGELRSLAGANAGRGPGPESSLLKIKGSEIQQRLTELSLEAVGHYGAPYFRGFGEGDNEHPIGPDYAHRTAPSYFNMRKTTIYGGSNEIQHNIIAKMVLGL